VARGARRADEYRPAECEDHDSRSILEATAYERTRRTLKRRLVAAFVLSFWSLCELLPVSWASALGGFVMNIVGLFVGRMRKVRANLEIALPDLSSCERDRIARDIRRNLGRTWSELPHSPKSADRTVHGSTCGGPNITSARLLRGDRWYSFLPTSVTGRSRPVLSRTAVLR